MSPKITVLTMLLACMSYTRYLLEIGQSEDWLALQMALAACLLGYGAAAKALEAREDTVREGNMYWKWIENYAGLEYAEAMRLGSGTFCPAFTTSLLLLIRR